jgi:hypothetical protein
MWSSAWLPMSRFYLVAVPLVFGLPFGLLKWATRHFAVEPIGLRFSRSRFRGRVAR